MHLPTLNEIKNLFSSRNGEIKAKIKEMQDSVMKSQAFLSVLQGMISESNEQITKVESLIKDAEESQESSTDVINLTSEPSSTAGTVVS